MLCIQPFLAIQGKLLAHQASPSGDGQLHRYISYCAFLTRTNMSGVKGPDRKHNMCDWGQDLFGLTDQSFGNKLTTVPDSERHAHTGKKLSNDQFIPINQLGNRWCKKRLRIYVHFPMMEKNTTKRKWSEEGLCSCFTQSRTKMNI